MVLRFFPKVSVSFFKLVKFPATVDVSPKEANVDALLAIALSAVSISGVTFVILVSISLDSREEREVVAAASSAAALIANLRILARLMAWHFGAELTSAKGGHSGIECDQCSKLAVVIICSSCKGFDVCTNSHDITENGGRGTLRNSNSSDCGNEEDNVSKGDHFDGSRR